MITRLSPDQELWNAIKEDDEKAFGLLFDRYWQNIYTTVFSVTEDREVCSEIVHDIFLNIWIKRTELNITFFKAYLTASARYHVYRYVKNSRKIPVTYTEDLISMYDFSSHNHADSAMRYQELIEEVERNMTVLPKRCKEIFALSRKEQLTNDEIAERLDISKRTVENQLTHALHHLRIAIKSFLAVFTFIGIL